MRVLALTAGAPRPVRGDCIFDGTITSVQVPAGARFLFVSAADSLFFDNSDPDGDFGVQLTVVPEPWSLALVGVGLVGLLGTVSRQKAGRPPVPGTEA